MASKFSIFTLAIWLLACEKPCGCDINPPSDELTGKWKFIKRVDVLIREIDQREKFATNVETLEFVNSSSYKRTIDGKVVKESFYTIQSNQTFKKFIQYSDDNTYQPFRIEESNGKKMLILYEIMPVGVVLADGSEYYYEKQ